MPFSAKSAAIPLSLESFAASDRRSLRLEFRSATVYSGLSRKEAAILDSRTVLPEPCTPVTMQA